MIIGKPVKRLVKIEPFEGIKYLGVIWKYPGQDLCIEGFSGRYLVVGLILGEQDKKKKKKQKPQTDSQTVK